METIEDRARGAVIGLAVGDAVGTTVEFKAPGSFPPVTDMTGGGPFGLEPGQFTDDTSMALCLAESLVETGRFDVADQLERYVRWWREGHLSSTGRCFDIGGATRSALARFEQSRDPGAGAIDENAAGNGSLMRLAPAALFARGDESLAAELAARSSLATHGARQATDACRAFAVMLTRAVAGATRDEVLDAACWASGVLHPEVERVVRGSYRAAAPPAIRGGGYVVECLEAALWAFWRSTTFAEGCLLAVNLGDDADTTGAVYGQLAGAFHGESGIPQAWRDRLALGATIDRLAGECARWHAASPVPPLPDLHCYWVEPGVLLAGEYTGARSQAEAERKLGSLLDAGIRMFVDLTEENESGLVPYASLLHRIAGERGLAVDYARRPVPDVGVPAEPAAMAAILADLASARRDGAPAYVHCWGGVGRTGTVVGCLQLERGQSAERALARVEELRRGTSKAHRRSPETAAQSAYVASWLDVRTEPHRPVLDLIPNRRYALADVPLRLTHLRDFGPVALSFDGYTEFGGFSVLAQFANGQYDHFAQHGELRELGLGELRGCLFFLQRALRHMDEDPWDDADAVGIAYVDALVAALRARLATGEEAAPAAGGQVLGPRFQEAFALAADLHAAQERKGTAIPYLAHLMAVASLVLEDGGDEDEAIAALLHDAVEDAGGAPVLAGIRARFGDRVAAIVDGCSDTDVTPKPPWRARKEAYIAHLAGASPAVIRVSLADKLHNARAILLDYRALGDELWSRFDPAADQLWYYRALAEAYRARTASPLAAELERTVAELERLARHG